MMDILFDYVTIWKKSPDLIKLNKHLSPTATQIYMYACVYKFFKHYIRQSLNNAVTAVVLFKSILLFMQFQSW